MAEVWLLQCFDDQPRYRVARIDARTGATTAAVEVVDPPPMAHDSAQLMVGAGAVWVAAGHVLLYRIDATHNRVVAALSIGHHLDGLAVTDDAVWLSNDRGGGRLYRIDPDDNRIDAAIPFRAHALAAGAGSLWATWKHSITRVEARSLETQARLELGGFVSQHAFGLSALWAVTLDDGSAGTDHELSRVWRIDPATNCHTQVAQLAGRPALVVGAGAVWLDQLDAEGRACLCRLDAATHQLMPFPSARLSPCVARDDEVWGLDFDGNPQGGALVRYSPPSGRAEIIGSERGQAVAASV